MREFEHPAYPAMHMARELACDEMQIATEKRNGERTDGGYYRTQAGRSLGNVLKAWPYDLPDLRTPAEQRADFWFEEARNEALGLEPDEFTPLQSADALDGGE